MPHQCVRCGKVYADGSNELLKGCGCGGKFFFFMKEKDLEKARELTVKLTKKEREQIEQDVLELAGEDFDQSKPVILDLESIRVSKPGKYELDLIDLFKGKPLVYRLEEGKYVIDLASTFKAKDLSEDSEKTE